MKFKRVKHHSLRRGSTQASQKIRGWLFMIAPIRVSGSISLSLNRRDVYLRAESKHCDGVYL